MDTITSDAVGFNMAPSTVMHIDLNSCFASIEQQANPGLRGKPVAVAAYMTDGGCILTASREAKVLGVDTGMRVGDARQLCRDLIVLPSDPEKYRYINRKLVALLHCYTDNVEIKSIDEMVLNLAGSPMLTSLVQKEDACQSTSQAMHRIGREIKQRIRQDIGDWLTVSIGIATNRYLAKVAAGLHKPDGMDEINGDTVKQVLKAMPLEGLTGIKQGYGGQLRRRGIHSALSFYQAPSKTLMQAFHSVTGHHWWLRLHGWEADDRVFKRKSFGQSYALYKSYPPGDTRVHQILCQLTEKMARRMRKGGFTAGGIHVGCQFSDYSYWHKGKKLSRPFSSGSDLYKEALSVLGSAPDVPVRTFAVSCHYLQEATIEQQQLFEDTSKQSSVTRAIDAIADRWGDFAVMPGLMLGMEHTIHDRIAFGGVKDLQEFVST